MYIVGVKLGDRRRKFLVKADQAYDAKHTMTELNIREKEAGEPLFDHVEYIETVEFEQNVMEV